MPLSFRRAMRNLLHPHAHPRPAVAARHRPKIVGRPQAPMAPRPVAAAQASTAPQPAPAAPIVGAGLRPPPPEFRVAPPLLPVPDGAALRELVCQGAPFPADVAAPLKAILGVPVRAGGVAALFAPLLPQATFCVSEAEPDGSGISFTLSGLSRAGEVIFAVGCTARRDPSGAIELHTYSAHVAPEFRGFGLTAQAEERLTALLRALSSHPDTRVTLAAGFWADPNSGEPQPSVGTYLHATRGYLYADSMGVTSEYFGFDDGTPIGEDWRRLSDVFDAWCDNEPTLRKDGRPATPEERQSLHGALRACRQPFELAAFDRAGFSAEVDIPGLGSAPAPLGKAYLLSSRAPVWFGVRFVNPPAPDAPEALVKLRQVSDALFHKSCTEELRRSAARAAPAIAGLWQQLHAPDAQTRCGAWQALGVVGDVRLMPWVQKKRDKAPVGSPERQAIEACLALMGGKVLVPALQAAAADPRKPEWVRDNMAARLAAVAAAVGWREKVG
jgi:hypothetical protein